MPFRTVIFRLPYKLKLQLQNITLIHTYLSLPHPISRQLQSCNLTSNPHYKIHTAEHNCPIIINSTPVHEHTESAMSSSPPISRSRASLSPSNVSPSHSMSKSYQDPSLETLVSHLLASKRSLSSISTAWRANEIVTSARTKLEESVMLNARTEFLRSGIVAQVKVLKRVRGGVEGVYREGTRDFKVCLLVDEE